LKEYPKAGHILGIVSSSIFGFVQEQTNFLMKYTASTFGMSAEERRGVSAAVRRRGGTP